jgi:UDP-2,4-diacetamido-2,4,6-trideoxy-beta-L-altropyranose hydrolase
MELTRELPPLLLRADADAERGSGHVMRCLALVQAWRERGGAAVFLSHCDSRALRARILAAGAEFLPLAPEQSTEADLEATMASLAVLDSSFVVLDGYHFDVNYQHALRAGGHRLMVIDDTVRLPFYDTDILLNQNLGAARLEYNCHGGTALLLGPAYALLRREFPSWRSRLHKVPQTARKILVTLGGSDPDNATLKVIQALRTLNRDSIRIRVVAGPANPHVDELRDAAVAFPGELELLTAVSDMASLMSWADLAVTGAGGTCWELACVGLPAVLLVIAENQRASAAELGAAGLVVNLGWHSDVSVECLANEINGLIDASSRRLCMSRRGKALVDGHGADRVAATLMNFAPAMGTPQSTGDYRRL